MQQVSLTHQGVKEVEGMAEPAGPVVSSPEKIFVVHGHNEQCAKLLRGHWRNLVFNPLFFDELLN
jgi:hypothetical protein